MSLSVRRGASELRDTAQAFEAVREAIAQPGLSVVLLFVGGGHDLALLARRIPLAFGAVPVLACTTAGEIHGGGYAAHSLTAVSLASPDLEVRLSPIGPLSAASAAGVEQAVAEVSGLLAARRVERPRLRAFGLLLIDGLSRAEESVIAGLSASLDEVPVIGGSAGDELRFRQTGVYHAGQFRPDWAVLATFYTTLPFRLFQTQHFVPREDGKLVITEADVEQRIVREINGYPAAQEYARLLGLDVARLAPMVFSRYPLMLRIGGQYYVRAIQKVNPDGSLTFFCAIDEGLVLTISQGQDMVENLHATFEELLWELPDPAVVLVCECVLRRLEIEERGLIGPMSDLMCRHRVVGFHTYGEQYNGLHINQTLVGVAIGGAA